MRPRKETHSKDWTEVFEDWFFQRFFPFSALIILLLSCIWMIIQLLNTFP